VETYSHIRLDDNNKKNRYCNIIKIEYIKIYTKFIKDIKINIFINFCNIIIKKALQERNYYRNKMGTRTNEYYY